MSKIYELLKIEVVVLEEDLVRTSLGVGEFYEQGIDFGTWFQ